MRSAMPHVVVLLVVSACASPGVPTTISQLDDPFRSYRQYSATTTTTAAPFSADRTSVAAQLLVRVDKKSAATDASLDLAMVYTSDTRRVYKTATNIRAEPLNVSVLQRQSTPCSRQTGICVRSERLAISLPEADLRNAGAEGYSLKVFSVAGGDLTVTIPKPTIVAILAKVDSDPGVAQATSGKVAAQAAH